MTITAKPGPTSNESVTAALNANDFEACPTCMAYAERRRQVLAPAMAKTTQRTGETAQQVVDRYMTAVHARHLVHKTTPTPAILLTDEQLDITSLNQLVANPDAWHALLGWLGQHGINATAAAPLPDPVVPTNGVLERTRTIARLGLAARDLSHAIADNLRRLNTQEEPNP